MPRRSNRDGDNNLNLQPLFDAFGRLNPRAQIALVAMLVLGFIALWFYEQHQTSHPSATVAAGDVNLLLGNPSDATADSSHRDNYLMVKPYFTLSYNDGNGTPNWVSWSVGESELGTAPRKEMFDPDSTLPAGFYHVTQGDYVSSGFDRGHMCPHGDRQANLDMSYATFVMTNIIPQAPNVNRKAWEHLESYCRDLVRSDHARLYIIAGPAGVGGVGSDGLRRSLAGGRVAVPAECWKIVVVVPEGTGAADLSKINAATRVISVLMPNDNTRVAEEWDTFRTTPSQIESATGLHFFTRLPPNIAPALRVKRDNQYIPPPRPYRKVARETPDVSSWRAGILFGWN